MLEVKKLSCGYGGEQVVNDISFTLSPGQRLVVLGPNGCGKTTLLRGLMGILPSTGTMEFDGRDLKAMTVREKGRTMAMLTQMNSVSFSYTVMETVLLGRYAHLEGGLFSTPGAEDRRMAEEQLKRLGLWQERDKRITELSGGQLQRVLLARTFVQEPRIILLDEPANHLDLKYQVELVEELKKWTSEPGRMAVGVFHDLDLALSFADTVLLMDRGRSVYLGSADGLDPEMLSRVFGIDVPGYMNASRRRWEKLRKSPYEAYPFLGDASDDLRCDFELMTDRMASEVGLLRAKVPDEGLKKELLWICELIYHMNPSLRTQLKVTEEEKDRLFAAVERLRVQCGDRCRRFVTPQGCETGCMAHILRVRGKELVRLLYRHIQQGHSVEPRLMDLANLLSGYFFYLALRLNADAGVDEIDFISRNY